MPREPESILAAGDRAVRKQLERADLEEGHHVTVEVDEQKTITAEVGGTTEQLSWSAYFRKVWRGPWIAGSTWKW